MTPEKQTPLMPPGRDNIPLLHIRRAQHFATGRAADTQRFAEEAMSALLKWYDQGAGSGSHLAEWTGLPPSNTLRALANILTCARESADVQKQLGELAE